MKAEIRWLLFLSAILASGIVSPVLAERAADPAPAAAAAGWEEYAPGRWNSLADRKVVEALPGRLSAEAACRPGSGAAWEKKGSWDPGKGVLSLEVSSTEANAKSEDYRQNEARFPVSVTAVFGKDSRKVEWKTRAWDFLRGIFGGFSPSGVRLTYAFGNRAPVGSMYRLSEEETVFILAGEEEKGKKVASKRNLSADYLAAYGSRPSGPVTAVVARIDRPRGEKGPLKASVSVALPGF